MRMLISIVIVVAVIAFAAANAAAVTLRFLTWEVSVSLALVVGITFLLGFVFGMLRLTPGLWHGRFAAKTNERALETMKKERDALAARVQALEKSARAGESASNGISPINKQSES